MRLLCCLYPTRSAASLTEEPSHNNLSAVCKRCSSSQVFGFWPRCLMKCRCKVRTETLHCFASADADHLASFANSCQFWMRDSGEDTGVFRRQAWGWRGKVGSRVWGLGQNDRISRIRFWSFCKFCPKVRVFHLSAITLATADGKISLGSFSVPLCLCG